MSVATPKLGFVADNRLSVHDRELFLAEPRIAALSVFEAEGRGPLTVPIWYQYEPGGEPWILTEAQSRKVRLIRAAGCFTLMVERVTPTHRYVSVEGEVSRIIPGTDEMRRGMAQRYLSPEKAEAYVKLAEAEFGEEIAIYLRPRRWLSSDMG
jgi:hypothetical protein